MISDSDMTIGIGDTNASIQVFIQNIPQRLPWSQLDQVEALPVGEIKAIGNDCGNGWRKVFNVYAKWLFAMRSIKAFEAVIPLNQWSCWQDYRDEALLQKNSNTSLLFSKPTEERCSGKSLNILMGRTYAKTCDLDLQWLDHEFAVNPSLHLLVCPYFDYRQLSNIKIIRLCEYIEQFDFLS